MKKVILGLVLTLSTLSTINAQVALHGLYTPVHLNGDTTRLYLRDYLADRTCSGFTLPTGLQNHSSSKDTLILSGKMPVKMDVLRLETEQGIEGILLINSALKPVTIKVAADKDFKGEVRLIGDFNNWNRGSVPLALENGYYIGRYQLNPGKYEYKFWANQTELLNPANTTKVSNGMGGFNHSLEVKYNQDEGPNLYKPLSFENRTLLLEPLPEEQKILGFWNNNPVAVLVQNQSNSLQYTIPVPEKASEVKRSYLRCYSYRGEKMANDLLIPLEYGKPVMDVSQLERLDWHQARMYFLMVDRFNNGNTGNDLPTPDPKIHPKANYLGGDLAGVTQKVEDGFFNNLHINTIWLSPITQNPEDAWGNWDKGEVKSKFSAYHGYWPVSNIRVDHRFGSAAELKKLLEDAHGDEKNMILDYVANHVHQNHPVYQKNKDWATALYLPDGSKNTEKWDEHRLTTWFDDHLPTLDLRRWEVVDPMVDSALFWVTQYDFDGFRHDATKHIDELYWRTLTYRLRQKTDRPIIQIGETYGSPQLINSYISTGMLDAQFDFNLYDAAVGAFAKSGGDLKNLVNKLQQGLSTYGYHHLMGNITGNQDRSRFISLASGDVLFEEDQKKAGWDRQIGKPKKEAYQRLAMLHAFNNAVPGIPCIYYGDEYGMPGGGDPDNRRMMEFSGLDADEAALLDKVKKLNELRATELALIYGTTEVEIIDPALLKITRSYFDEQVIIYINTSSQEKTVKPSLADHTQGKLHFGGTTFQNVNARFIPVKIPPLSFEYITVKPSLP